MRISGRPDARSHRGTFSALADVIADPQPQHNTSLRTDIVRCQDQARSPCDDTKGTFREVHVMQSLYATGFNAWGQLQMNAEVNGEPDDIQTFTRVLDAARITHVRPSLSYTTGG